MDTLLLCPFKDFFSRFALTFASVKYFMLRRLALQTNTSPVTILFKKFRNNHYYAQYEKNRHATCLKYQGFVLVVQLWEEPKG